jgi:AcrR family transcriptional regulator
MNRTTDNAPKRLVEEARRQIAERGYAQTTVRSIAAGCYLSVGTVYNYFASKDMLIATFMLDDWRVCLRQMKEVPTQEPKVFLQGIDAALRSFIGKHQDLFHDADAAKSFATSASKWHKQLCDQFAAVLRPVCDFSSCEDKEYLSQFLAESFLTWTMAEESFEKLYSVLGMLLK